MPDVIVVGGGPAGLTAARYASKNGAETLVLEEDAQIGLPAKCGGLVSVRVIRETGAQESVINGGIRGAHIFTPAMDQITVESDEIKACSIDRRKFDEILASGALEEDATILTGHKVTGVHQSGKVQVMNDVYSAEVIIAADGVKGSIAKQIGLGRPKIVVAAAQLEGKYEMDDDFVEVYLGRDYAPSFFAWAIPLDGGWARIGVGCERDPLGHLDRLIRTHPVVSKKYRGEVRNKFASAIPIGPLDRTVCGRVLVVGDAAAQVKPISGGGIYPSLVCGRIAGEVAAESMKGMKIERYEKLWRREIGKEISRGMRLRRMVNEMGDEWVSKLLLKLKNNEKLLRIVSKYGDLDYQSAVLRKLLWRVDLIAGFLLSLKR